MITPSLYSKDGNSNCVDNLVEDFSEYVKFRAEEFNLRCRHDNISSLAFIHSFEDIAEKHLDIPRMLNEEDMVNNGIPDELSVMAYVPSYYQALAGAHKVKTASNRIFKVVRVIVHTQIKMWIQR